MNIDTTAFFDILKLANHEIVNGLTKTQFRDNARHYWGRIFNTGKYGERFRCYINTDLVSVSISIFKKKKEKDKDKYEIVDLSNKRVIGLDPGRRDLFVAVERMDNDERVIKCGTKEYRDMLCFVKNRKKR